MISYCLTCLRPTYDKILIDDLIRKTTTQHEILIWYNTPDVSLRQFVESRQAAGAQIRVIGDTPHNIGMDAFKPLFQASTQELIVQLDDDVLWVSRRIAEIAKDIFSRHPSVRQLVADVCQDTWTTGARPPMKDYTPISEADGLYNGPIDGWFSIYHRSVLPILLEAPYQKYTHLGHWMWGRLPHSGFHGFLCTKFKVFHVAGPAYSAHFGMKDFEVEKYNSVDRGDLAKWYLETPKPPKEVLDYRIDEIQSELEILGAEKGGTMKHTYEHAIKPTDIHQHLTMLYGLVVGMGAQKVIELGVNTGESTVAFLEALQVTGGKLFSVDIVPCVQARAMMQGYGLTKNWAFTMENDLDYVKKWDGGQVDIVFVDTSHEREQTKKEIAAFEPLLRPGGVMVFHDTVTYPTGVFEPILEFLSAHQDYKFVNHEHCCGLGLMKKPGGVSPGWI